MIDILRGLIGMAAIIGMAYAFSKHKKHINWRLVGTGLSIQFVLAIFILKGRDMAAVWAPLRWPKDFFSWVSSFFVIVLEFTTEGAKFIFGDLALSPGMEDSLGNFFAFQVLPTIIFFASLTAILYHYGILQKLVKYMAKGMQKLMGTNSGELKWREIGEKEILWAVSPSHPILRGLPEKIVIEHEEMYGEFFNIPDPDELVLISWFGGGNVFRSGLCYKRGLGKLFYFRPGHESFPIYYQKEVQQILINAANWAAPAQLPQITTGHTPQPIVTPAQ